MVRRADGSGGEGTFEAGRGAGGGGGRGFASALTSAGLDISSTIVAASVVDGESDRAERGDAFRRRRDAGDVETDDAAVARAAAEGVFGAPLDKPAVKDGRTRPVETRKRRRADGQDPRRRLRGAARDTRVVDDESARRPRPPLVRGAMEGILGKPSPPPSGLEDSPRDRRDDAGVRSRPSRRAPARSLRFPLVEQVLRVRQRGAVAASADAPCSSVLVAAASDSFSGASHGA